MDARDLRLVHATVGDLALEHSHIAGAHAAQVKPVEVVAVEVGAATDRHDSPACASPSSSPSHGIPSALPAAILAR